jgi:hypothetical protein
MLSSRGLDQGRGNPASVVFGRSKFRKGNGSLCLAEANRVYICVTREKDEKEGNGQQGRNYIENHEKVKQILSVIKRKSVD